MLSKQMSELTVSESSEIDDCIRKSAVTNESMKKFKAADAGWEPTTTAERELSKELKYVSTGHLYPVRHDRAVAPTEVEFKFLNEKNGGHNLAAVIKGHSEQTIVVYEKDENKEEVNFIYYFFFSLLFTYYYMRRPNLSALSRVPSSFTPMWIFRALKD